MKGITRKNISQRHTNLKCQFKYVRGKIILQSMCLFERTTIDKDGPLKNGVQ